MPRERSIPRLAISPASQRRADVKNLARASYPRRLGATLLIVVPFVFVQCAAAEAAPAHLLCKAQNGTGFRADIDPAARTVVFHGSTDETFVNGQKSPASVSGPNDGCTDFVDITDASYAWGYRCNNHMTYSSRIDRYSGAYVREINGGNWGRADCAKDSGQPRL